MILHLMIMEYCEWFNQNNLNLLEMQEWLIDGNLSITHLLTNFYIKKDTQNYFNFYVRLLHIQIF